MSIIPQNLKEIHEELKKEIIWLHGRWTLFTQLFAMSDKRIDLLNECAPSFFHTIEDVLVGDVMLSLCKVTDPATTRTRAGNFDNMSLKQLQQRLEAEEPHLAHHLQSLLNKLDDKCKAFREWRNKSLAHSDLATASGAYLLPEISKKMVDEALNLMRNYMNAIQAHYDNGETSYWLLMNKDGHTLVSVLIDGLRYRELEQEKKISWDDRIQSQWNDA